MKTEKNLGTVNANLKAEQAKLPKDDHTKTKLDRKFTRIAFSVNMNFHKAERSRTFEMQVLEMPAD